MKKTVKIVFPVFFVFVLLMCFVMMASANEYGGNDASGGVMEESLEEEVARQHDILLQHMRPNTAADTLVRGAFAEAKENIHITFLGVAENGRITVGTHEDNVEQLREQIASLPGITNADIIDVWDFTITHSGFATEPPKELDKTK